MLVGGQASAKNKHSLGTYHVLGPLVPQGVGWCQPPNLLMAAMPPLSASGLGQKGTSFWGPTNLVPPRGQMGHS